MTSFASVPSFGCSTNCLRLTQVNDSVTNIQRCLLIGWTGRSGNIRAALESTAVLTKVSGHRAVLYPKTAMKPRDEEQ